MPTPSGCVGVAKASTPRRARHSAVHQDGTGSCCLAIQGTATTWEKRERPHLVWDEHMDPQWLVTGAVLPGAAGGYHGGSFTLIQGVDSS